MSSSEDISGIIAKNIDLPFFIKCSYSGFICVSLALISPTYPIAKAFLKYDNSIIVAGGIFLLGLFIWVLYRHFIGEFIVYPVTHVLHELFCRNSSDIVYIKELGVEDRDSRFAYVLLRGSDFFAPFRKQLNLSHTYNHVLDITWLECLTFSIFFGDSMSYRNELLVASTFIYFASICIDIRQHSFERHLMQNIGDEKLKTFFASHGLIRC